MGWGENQGVINKLMEQIVFAKVCDITRKKTYADQEERGQQIIYYTCPQSFDNFFWVGLTTQGILLNFDWLVH